MMTSGPLDTRTLGWRRTRRLTAALLVVWAVVTFGSGWFARELSGIVVFGSPLSFWIAAQGAPLAYLALVGWYARAMRRLEEDLGCADDEGA